MQTELRRRLGRGVGARLRSCSWDGHRGFSPEGGGDGGRPPSVVLPQPRCVLKAKRSLRCRDTHSVLRVYSVLSRAGLRAPETLSEVPALGGLRTSCLHGAETTAPAQPAAYASRELGHEDQEEKGSDPFSGSGCGSRAGCRRGARPPRPRRPRGTVPCLCRWPGAGTASTGDVLSLIGHHPCTCGGQVPWEHGRMWEACQGRRPRQREGSPGRGGGRTQAGS